MAEVKIISNRRKSEDCFRNARGRQTQKYLAEKYEINRKTLNTWIYQYPTVKVFEKNFNEA